MALFGSKTKTAQQKAQKAQFRIFARFACCAYLIFYVIIPMLKPAPDGDSMNPTLRILVVVAFSIITVVILAFSGKELFLNWKAGLYKADAYTDDPVDGADEQVAGGEQLEIEAEAVIGSDDGDDEDYYEDDEYDDEDDEYDDEDDEYEDEDEE